MLTLEISAANTVLNSRHYSKKTGLLTSFSTEQLGIYSSSEGVLNINIFACFALNSFNKFY
jgi:hypothetical protein